MKQWLPGICSRLSVHVHINVIPSRPARAVDFAGAFMPTAAAWIMLTGTANHQSAERLSLHHVPKSLICSFSSRNNELPPVNLGGKSSGVLALSLVLWHSVYKMGSVDSQCNNQCEITWVHPLLVCSVVFFLGGRSFPLCIFLITFFSPHSVIYDHVSVYFLTLWLLDAIEIC